MILKYLITKYDTEIFITVGILTINGVVVFIQNLSLDLVSYMPSKTKL